MTTDQRISENTVGKAQLEHNALYIGGRWRAARSRPRFLAVNPETEQPLGSFPDASSEPVPDVGSEFGDIVPLPVVTPVVTPVVALPLGGGL